MSIIKAQDLNLNKALTTCKTSHTQRPMSNHNTATMSLEKINNDQTNGTNITNVEPPQTVTSRG